MRKYIGRRGPFTRFAEYHDGRSAESEHRFFLASLEGQIKRVDLRYPPNRQGADLHKSETPEVTRFKDVYVALVREQDIRFALECMPVHGP